MKILILCFLLFSLNSFAGYMSKSLMLNQDCETDRPFYPLKRECDKKHSDCISVRKGFNCQTDSEQDTSVDDTSSPIIVKRDLDTCVDDDECQTKLVALVCTDTSLTAIKRLDLDPKEVYCPEQIGFNQKTVRMIREDAVKKAAWDVNSANPKVRRALRKARRQQLAAAITTIDGANLTQLKAIVKKMMRDKYSNN